MKLSAFLTIVLFLCCSIMLAVPDATEAARLGGGSSFGSKPFMSTPAPRPTMRPVSYTHLDVYKRQVQARALAGQQFRHGRVFVAVKVDIGQ